MTRLGLRLLVAAAIVIAGVLIYRALREYSLAEIAGSVRQLPGARLAAAVGFAGASYLCLTGFDWLAVRYAGRPLPWRRAALASFVSLSIGHNIGIAALSSGAIRYRFYARWGLDAGDLGKIILFAGTTVGLGLATLGGIALIRYPGEGEVLLGLGSGALAALASVCLAAPAIYLMLSAFLRRRLRFRRWTIEMPALRLAVPQVAIGTLNFACVAGCLHQLLAAFTEVPYLQAASVYVIGNVAALLSHVPGGIGVLEATVLAFLPGAAAIGAVVAFRVIYFFLPLAIGLPLLLASEYFLREQGASEHGAQQALER